MQPITIIATAGCQFAGETFKWLPMLLFFAAVHSPLPSRPSQEAACVLRLLATFETYVAATGNCLACLLAAGFLLLAAGHKKTLTTLPGIGLKHTGSIFEQDLHCGPFRA